MRNLMRWYLNPLVIGGSILLALLLFLITLSIIWFTRPGGSSARQATAVLHVIRFPTATLPHPSPTPAANSTSTPLASSAPSNGIAVGSYIQIVGTGGDGLRLRINPSLDGQVRFIGFEGEIFLVEDGPQEGDGFVWWYLVGTDDETLRGWAVTDYMEVAQYP